MALSIILIMFVGLILIFIVGALVAVFMLNRSWGDMNTPVDVSQQPSSGRTAFANISYDPKVAQLLAEGKEIEAIKYVREQTGWGLKEAKDYVDGLAGRDAAAPPATPVPTGHVALEVEQTARSFVTEGKKLQAIKYVREQTGLGLKEAKEFVEGL